MHLYRNITVVPSWRRRNSLAHMCFAWCSILHWCTLLQKHSLSSSFFSAKVHFSLWFKWQQKGVFLTEVNSPQYSRNLRPVLSPCLTQLLGLAQELQPQMNCNCKLKLLLITSSYTKNCNGGFPFDSFSLQYLLKL